MMAAIVGGQGGRTISRTPDGRPDLTGIYDANTLTPVERPAQFSGLILSDDEATTLARGSAERTAKAEEPSDPNRQAPQVGGNVGGYNTFWMARGTRVVSVNGKKRSSIVIDPPDGKIPPMTAGGRARDETFGGLAGRNDVLERRGERPSGFDDPELRPLGDRCLTGWGWTAGPPILPNYLYNNLKQIVQTPTHVMILTEMVHEVRVVRIGGKHLPPQVRNWSGDSVGRWEGDTLVVETTNIRKQAAYGNASEQLKITERFTPADENTLSWQVRFEDPATWAAPWALEMPLKRDAESTPFEYACHEGNHGLRNILSAARAAEHGGKQ
jgi:hypothetical protein